MNSVGYETIPTELSKSVIVVSEFFVMASTTVQSVNTPHNFHRSSRNFIKKGRTTLTNDWEKVGLRKKEKSIFQRTPVGSTPPQEPHPARIEYHLPIHHFLTGSSYEGTWNALGFTGFGTYFFPHGAIYSGDFKNGQFHGRGTITYPMGHTLECVHRNGKLISKLFVFDDGLEVHRPNLYCQIPDRRFQVEFNTTLAGAGKEFLTNRQPTLEIPEGCYDTVDGFYVPSVECIYKYDEESLINKTDARPQHKRITDTLKRTALVTESKLIGRHYRKSSIGSVGYRPDLYETWLAGRKKEVEHAISHIHIKVHEPKDAGGGSVMSVDIDSSSENPSVTIEFEKLNTSY